MHDEEFRRAVRAWLADNVTAELRGVGGPGREDQAYEQRLAFNRRLAAAGWTCLGWPVRHGGRGAPLSRQVIFHEEYARARAPARVDHFGETLVGPTLIAFGTPEQQQRFLPRIRSVEDSWCQGYSEPGAGSDLAAVATRARLDGGEWVIDGQKVWTSAAHRADWCFLLVRTRPVDPAGPWHAGLSYLLVPMRQPGVTVRPIRQLTGECDFNEVFFDGARTARDLVVGEVDNGWRVAMGTLTFERGAATLGQQVGFGQELDALIALARRTGALADPAVRDGLARAYIGLSVLRSHAVRGTQRGGADPAHDASVCADPARDASVCADPARDASAHADPARDASVQKVLWSRWHRGLGELAMQVRGAAGMLVGAPYDVDEWQRLFLFSRADTIYGGSDEIQHSIIAERVLGLPRQARR